MWCEESSGTVNAPLCFSWVMSKSLCMDGYSALQASFVTFSGSSLAKKNVGFPPDFESFQGLLPVFCDEILYLYLGGGFVVPGALRTVTLGSGSRPMATSSILERPSTMKSKSFFYAPSPNFLSTSSQA